MKFNIENLIKIIEKRIKSGDKNSYTYKLYKNPALLRKKLLEEAGELVKTKNKKQVAWEAADLLYFILVFLAKRKVKLKEIEKMLEQRNINKSIKIKLNKLKGGNR